MTTFSHDYEPIRGLPADLPDGETILWQGAPDWLTLARHGTKIRIVAVWFVLLAVWGIAGGVSSGTPALDIALSTLRLAGLGVLAIAVLTFFAWMVAKTTVYTITSRRVVFRFGIAIPITLQVAFPMINSAGANLRSGGDGDVAISVRHDIKDKTKAEKISYFVLWPHIRPWKLAKPEPTLRCVPDAAAVAQILGRALAASAEQPAQPMPVVVTAVGKGIHVPATA